MDQAMRAEVPGTGSSSRPVSRAHSILGEKPTFSKTILSPPPPVRPDPAYISSSAAAQWVSAELDDDDMSVSDGALFLLNSFLDQMLFSFLSSARSTRLPQLRQAIPEVLKPRLGKEAVASADEELREYLGDGDDEELTDFYDGQEPARDFDLELAWKLARLRCMVYTRLGDLEEEDTLEIIEREKLDERGGQSRRFSSRSNSITPAGAIFLTSIIEYLGEQALYHAGTLAQTRASNVHPQPPEGSAETAVSRSRLPTSNIIEEIDVRRLGREGPLARIWRNWRRPIRSPQESFSRPLSPSDEEGPASPSDSPRQRAGTMGSLPLPTIAQTMHENDPAQIPLPISENDIDEIEVPGLAREIDDFEVEGSPETQAVEKTKRPNSMIFLPSRSGQLTPISNYMPSNIPHSSPLRPAFGRQRSQSLPTPPQSPIVAVAESQKKKADSTAPTESDNVDNEAGSANVTENTELARDVVEQDEEPSKRHGLVIAGMPALPDAPGSRPTVVDDDLQTRGAEPADAVRETVADRMLQSPAVEDQVPPSAVTEASIHSATDFNSMQLPERQQTSMTDLAETANGETDPEDLALSSAEDEPEPTRQRSKHDSVPPIQVGSSSYTYSTQPSDNYIPMPRHTDFPEAPIHHQAVIVAPRQVVQPGPSANPLIAPPATPDRPSTSKEQKHIAQELPDQLEPKAPRDLPLSSARTSLAEPTLGRNGDVRLSQRSSHSTTSSKLLGYTRDDQGRPLPSTEYEDGEVRRAAPTGSSQASNDTWHTPSTSVGGPHDVRPGTAGSQQPSAKRPSKLRMSDDGKEALGKSSFESEAKKKTLELLIQGDETLHYTLTPTSARAPEFPDTIRQVMAPAQDSGDSSKNGASPNQPFFQHKAQPSVGSTKSANGLRAHPLKDEFAPQAAAEALVPPPSSPRIATSRPGTASSKVRHGQPRDAKVESSTSRDLADYLRSTGPESDNQLPRALVSQPATSNSQAPPTVRSAVQQPQPVEQSRTTTKASGQAPLHSLDAAIPSGGPSTTATSRTSGSSRYVPRDAQISKNSTTSALADFIREGPPRAAGDHRIPRTVAPFRTTMDSDDLNGLVSSTDKDRPARSSAASTQDSSTVSRSVQSSVNSHTGLLDRSKKTKPGQSTNGMRTGTSTISSSSQSTAREAMPKQKQRKVRDPYAIDDSDDDIEEVATLKPKRDEESLIDFLRNTAPLPSMTAQPIVAANSPAAPKQNLQKKNSSSAIKDRIRNTGIPGLNRKNSVTTTDPPAYSRGSVARAESPHLSQAGSKLDSYKPTQPTHAAHVDRVRSSRINSAISSSAEHLPHSEQSRAARTVNTTRDESGFRAFFSRKKSVRQ